jgi:two-component system, LuxR family, response regulator FixJ
MPADYRIAYVVDDEAPVRRSLALLLRSAGFAVQAYDSGEAFLRAAAATGALRFG